MAKLIIIRGNSGSGKSTIAQNIQNYLGEGVMLIGQDEVRRHMLNVKDKPRNLSINLIEKIAEYGIKHCNYVIIEGILNKQKYGTMLQKLIEYDGIQAYVYYFDLAFNETVRRHHMKENTNFDKQEMAKWFIERDFLNVQGEFCINQEMTEMEILQQMLNDMHDN